MIRGGDGACIIDGAIEAISTETRQRLTVFKAKNTFGEVRACT